MRQVIWGGLLGLLLGRVAIELGVTVWPLSNEWLRVPLLGQLVNFVMGALGAGVGGVRSALGERPSLAASAVSGYLLGVLLTALVHGYFLSQSDSDELIKQLRSWPELLREGWGLVGMGVGLVLGMLPPKLLGSRES